MPFWQSACQHNRLACAVLGIASVSACSAGVQAAALTELGLEDLMRIEVTSVSKRPQRLADTPAAVHVLTQEDIRSTGATSIPDVLRLVPGLEVARIDGSNYAIAARGFNSNFANKLLVLVDGRTVYSPLTSGVFWDVQDTLLEDIERIEVIRGPGAVVWGSNATNGVINIITKRSTETLGGLVSAAYGPTENRAGARYGLTLGESTTVRLFATNVERNDMVRFGDSSMNGGVWRQQRAGFRSDSELTAQDTLTFKGEIYDGESGQPPIIIPDAPPLRNVTGNGDRVPSGGFIQSRWRHRFSDTSNLAVDLYYDRTTRRLSQSDQFRDRIDTVDFTLQHTFRAGDRHNIIWGGGYRNYSYDTVGAYVQTYNPSSADVKLSNVYAQDEIALVPEKLRLSLGLKIERISTISETPLQPDARLLWSPTENQTYWMGVSRAVRLPSLFEQFATTNIALFPGSPAPVLLSIIGNNDIKPEKLTAYQLGYRAALSTNSTLDVTAFYNDYDRLITITEGGFVGPVFSPPPVHFENRQQFVNTARGRSYGLETLFDWRVLDHWKLQASHTFITLKVERDGVSPVYYQSVEGSTPLHRWFLRSLYDLNEKTQLDLTVRHSGALAYRTVPSYTTFDLRLGYKPTTNVELSLIGRDLADAYYPQFSNEGATPYTELGRSVLLHGVWRF